MDAPGNLELARELYRNRAWNEAYRSLSLADGVSSLGVEDLERFAVAAYLSGRDLEFSKILDRAHQEFLRAGEEARAARGAYWVSLGFLQRGDLAQSTGWLSRAQRLIEDRDCVERGYVLLTVAEQHIRGGKPDLAHATASIAAGIGDRFREPDVSSCARYLQGRALIGMRQVEAGLALLDEAMLGVAALELSPVMTGLVYCSVIETCQKVYALSRAREWTTALARWCAEQPQMVAFTAACLVHRSEILQLSGDWAGAMEEARRACECPNPEIKRNPPATALYRRGELHRLRGELAAAEDAYMGAARLGREPQPGLALLRLAQGRPEAARASMLRVLGGAADSLDRARLLPAHIEIALAVREVGDARASCGELEQVADMLDADALRAAAAQARGSILLAENNAFAALAPLRRAFDLWQQLDAAYETALVGVLIGRACRAMGDEEAGDMELAAAGTVFARLGAAPQLARLETLRKSAWPRSTLTPRENQVLRLIAAGKTNRIIAAELHLSERTVDRHVSNILNKLNAPSRAAAVACAYSTRLL